MSDPGILYINNYPADYGDVLKIPSLTEEVNFDSSINIPDEYSYELDNTDTSKYDPKVSGSLLYGTQIFGLPVYYFDSSLGRITMRGIIKNVSTDSSDGKLTLDCTSQLSALSENDCQIVETGITPADAMYKLLTSPITLGDTTPIIDPSYIDLASFKFAAGVQKYNKCTIDIGVYKDSDDTKKYSDVLPELSKIGHCFLYSHYDRIYLWQYTNRKNPSIFINDIIAGSYKDGYSIDDAYKIRNSYVVTYKSGSNIVMKRGKDIASIRKYGESIFGVPTDDVDSDSSADFSIIIDNATGATWCGETALERFTSPSLICNFSLEYKYNSIKVGDVIGLDFSPFDETPVLVIMAEYDESSNKIMYKCLFL